jgi:hypothetical protein
LVFPAEIELDNVILSGDPDEIEKKKLGNKYTIEDKIEAAAMFVYWMIAIHNGSHCVMQKEKASTQSAFD